MAVSNRVRSAIALAIGLSSAGCGSANLLSSNDETVTERGRALPVPTYAGSVNVSDVAGLEPSFESQTAAAVLRGQAVVAYRAGDPDFTSYLPGAGESEEQRVCPGLSELSYSVGEPASREYERARVPPPRDIAALWGPVALLGFGDAVIASALASPSDRFAAVANDAECLRTSDAPSSSLPRSPRAAGALAGACLIQLPAGPASCVRRGDHAFEGGSLAATQRYVYAAYRDAASSSVALFRGRPGQAFSELAAPASAVDSEVLVAATAARLFLVYGSGTELRLLRYDEASAGWEDPIVLTSDLNRRHVPGRRGRPVLSVRGFTLGVLEGEPPTLAAFWQRRVGSTQRTTLRGVLCDTAPGGSCRWPKHLSLSNSRDHFLPSIVSTTRRAPDGTLGHRHLLSYWREPIVRSGRVELRVAEFDEQRLKSRPVVDASSWPCPLLGATGAGDWGEADASFVIGQGSARPVAYRAFTDSSGGECDARAYRATPQHVSVIALPEF